MLIARASNSSGLIQKGMEEFVIVDFINNLNKKRNMLLNSEMITACHLLPVKIGEELATLANISF